MKRCPFCAEEIQDAAIVCRFCQRDLPVSPAQTKPTYLHGIALEDPVAPTTEAPESEVPKGRTSVALLWIAGIVIITFGFPFLLDRTTPVPGHSAPSDPQPSAAPEPAPRVELLSQTGGPAAGGSYMEVNGQVRNASTTSLRNVQAVVTWYDAQGGFITSDSALIEYNPLLAGQTSPFKVLTQRNPAMERFRVDFSILGGSMLDVTRPPK
jgi:hypothetical protein